ncbi:MAG: HAMP domain-containing sensor histidine kinase [Polyangiales bacterium]
MGDGGDSLQVELQRVAALRYRVYASTLALLTGLGLFFAAGVRDGSSWAVFMLSAVAAVFVPGRLFVALSRSESSNETHPRDPRAALGSIAASASAVPDPRERLSESSGGPDEVDYLRALRHEFRTPLNAVLGFSDVLLSGIDGDVNASQREDLEIIRASGIRLRVLLDSALDISQLAQGELRLDTERVDVAELVSRATAEARQLWSNKRHVQCTLPNEPCIAEADEARLRRSILVLADFLATSHREADIAVSLTPSGDYFAIEVRADSSDRPTLEALPTTAEVLAAEDMTKIRQWPVAVTSELIGRHGGSLYHGSSPSRFMIRLPVGGRA